MDVSRFTNEVDCSAVKAAYYSFPKKKINILKSVKLKQQDISPDVLVTAIDEKCVILT